MRKYLYFMRSGFGLLLILVLSFGIIFTSGPVMAEEDEPEPAIEFENIPLIYRDDLTQEFGVDLATQMKAIMGSSADMFKIDVWIYEVDGVGTSEDEVKECVSTLLEDYSWPGEVRSIPLEETDFGSSIEMMVESYGEEIAAVWGDDWTARAKQAAEEHGDRTVYTKAYVVSDPATNVTFSVSVTSPFGSTRTFAIYEGVYVILTQMSINI
ncbi:MAG: hypothetical protein UMV23_01380 [Halanaerobium sp.]|nr:hypothetical protein [Halanaerobium sp.]